MKTIPAGLLTELQSRTPRVCYLLEIQVSDGAWFRFNDSNITIVSAGDTFQPGLTVEPQATKNAPTPTNFSVQLLVDSALITQPDLSAGRFDGAIFSLYLTSWADPTVGRVKLPGHTIGDIVIGDTGATADARSLADKLRQNIIRTYAIACNVDVLGDARCNVDLAPFTKTGTVTAVTSSENNQFDSSDLGAEPSNWYQFGQFTWTSGQNIKAGIRNQVKAHTQEGSLGRITLAFVAPFPIQVGDGFTVIAGCDKSQSTCINKFNNINHFRGFPFTPGPNAILKIGGQ